MQVSRLAAPLIILLVALGIATGLYIFRPHPEARIPTPIVPVVTVAIAQPESIQLQVVTQGTVRARTRTTLSAEVEGVVVEMSPTLLSGAILQKGDLILRIDASDYEARLAEAVAAKARARARLQEEEALALQAADEWQDLGRGEAGPLVLREPQLAEARAAVLSAEAGYARAQRDLERTAVRSPYTAVVVDKKVDLGQRVMVGTALAEIYGKQAVEVRVPVSEREIVRLGDVGVRSGLQERATTPEVVVSADFGGVRQEWTGWLERIEGEVAADTRFYYLVVRVDRPFATDSAGVLPLKPGMFVTVAIPGRSVDNAVDLPRSALVANREVRIVDADGRLRTRPVVVVQSDHDSIVVDRGLSAGDRVVISPLALFVEGMTVTIEGEVADEPATAAGRAD